MRLIKLYEEFNNDIEIDEICKIYDIRNYTINSDGSIDVNESVSLYNEGLDKLPLRFNIVNGNFDCSKNNLTSLEGCPKKVTGHFECYENDLKSLEGAPEEVGGNYICNYNLLKSLNGCPKIINGDFDCSTNGLRTLEGAPEEVGGLFECNENQLVSLEGCPRTIGGDFWCNDNNLYSLEGISNNIGGYFFCDDNPVHNVWVLIGDCEYMELFLDYDIIIDKDKVSLLRLNDLLNMIGENPVTSVKGYTCIS